MKAKTRRNIQTWVAGFACCASGIHFALAHNWSALLWCIFATALLVYLFVVDNYIKIMHKAYWKSAKINKKLTRLLVIEQGRNEAMLANCSRYLKQLTKIKNHEDTHKRGAESAGKGNDED